MLESKAHPESFAEGMERGPGDVPERSEVCGSCRHSKIHSEAQNDLDQGAMRSVIVADRHVYRYVGKALRRDQGHVIRPSS